MEHIVQFAVSIDDDRIQKIMEESAAKQISDDIKKASHGVRNYSSDLNKEPENLKKLFKESIDEYVKENADKIIEIVVPELVKNMMKTKKVKEAIEGVVNGVTK